MYESGYGRQESPGVLYRRQGERFKDYERVLDGFRRGRRGQVLHFHALNRT